MNRMRLVSLHLRNFKGIRKLDLEPNGENLSVFGDNGTGKTTIADAATFLLFGKDSANRADFEVKTLDEEGQVATSGADHSVEGVFEVDGRRLTLKRTFREKWTKKRGSAKKEFTGHETDYHIDGVPEKKTEFDKVVASFADEKRFRLLTDPLFFNTQLHWKDRRAILVEACGDVSDTEIIEANPDLAELSDILEGRSLDDYRKIAEAKRREINKELEHLPTRIDEATEGMPAVAGTRAEAQAAVDEWKSVRRELDDEIARVRAGGGAVDLRNRISEIDIAIRDGIDDLTRAKRQNAHEAFEEAERARAVVLRNEREIARLTEDKNAVSQRIAKANSDREKLRVRYGEIRAEEYQGSPVSDTCAACGRPLPPEKVAETQEKVLAAYNSEKAERLERVRVQGHEAKAEADRLEHRLADLLAAIEEAEKAQADAVKAADAAEAKSKALEGQVPDPEQNEAIRAWRAEKDELRAKMQNAEQATAEAVAEIEAKAREVDEVLQDRQTALSAFDQVEKSKARIAELKAREKELTQAYEEVERHLYLMDEFTRAKVEVLTEKINGRFHSARFRLFAEQVNGGLEETCVTTYRGVPYDSLNHGARLNVGLDIINTLAMHYGFAPPVFIDNAESVTSLLDTVGQAIRLVVSASDKSLRIEQAEKVVN